MNIKKTKLPMKVHRFIIQLLVCILQQNLFLLKTFN